MNENEIAQQVGQVLVTARRARGWTAERAAQLAGVAQKTWARAENGQDVRAGSWMRIAAVFGLHGHALLDALHRPGGVEQLTGELGLNAPVTAPTRASSDERENRAFQVVAAVIRHLLNDDEPSAIQLLDSGEVISTRSDVIDIVLVMSKMYAQQLLLMSRGDPDVVRDVVDRMMMLGHGLPINPSE